MIGCNIRLVLGIVSVIWHSLYAWDSTYDGNLGLNVLIVESDTSFLASLNFRVTVSHRLDEFVVGFLANSMY